MRIRIKAPAGLSTSGIYGADGKEIAVGTEIVVKEDPTGWAGRYDVIDADEKPGQVPVLNPADGQPLNKASDAADGENPFFGAENGSQDQMDTGARSAAADEPELDRDELKKQADDLGIDYPANVKTAKLKELIDAKNAE